MNDFLVAIPVYNERSYLDSVVERVRQHVPNILLIDDGSTDGTRELIQELSGVCKLFHPENRGYGQAMISAIRFAACRKYPWLITMDCDEQHEPDLLPVFVREARRDDADVISGSRYIQSGPADHQPPEDRRRINHTINLILNELLGLQLTDSFCGFKAYRTAAVRALELDIPGYAFPLQFWVQAVQKGLRIREIAVTLLYHDPSRHFGGLLDDPDARLAHYLEVLTNELVKTRLIEPRAAALDLGSLVTRHA